VDERETDPIHGDIPEGVGPEVFRDQLRRAARNESEHGAHIRLRNENVRLEDVDTVEAEAGGHRSRVRLRNGVIIGGLTGAAIVAALATVRYRRRHQ
jgi:hypothetical protein